MKTMTIAEYHAALKAQGTKDRAKLCMICPMCGTIQNAEDLIRAGAGATFEDVEQYLGFSCVGRWTHQKPPPKVKGTQVGCDWTLGGFLPCCDLVVVTEDGQKHPRFDVATPEQSQAYLEMQTAAPVGPT
jgi:hypothetical protein